MMSDASSEDPLASPTLALLYMAQGHLRRARATVDAMLEEDPACGQALAMRARLHARAPAHITLSRSATAITARWVLPRSRFEGWGPLHILIATWAPNECATSVRFTSHRCASARGSIALPRRSGPASTAVCLGGLDTDGHFVPITVGVPMSW
ncbi:MAG: hypothetical protein V3V08_14600 [Nannocystaceae bacterium]